MEIGESIAVLVTTPEGKEKCWACEADPPPARHNDLDESPSSVGEPENQLTNDSSKLGLKLGHRPEWKINVPDVGDSGPIVRECLVVPAAHHLIPGNASLNEVPSILDLIDASRGKVDSDIGYDVNAAQNGVWLPANYGVRLESSFGKRWRAYSFKDDYAKAAMKRAGAQFHDSHPEYSGNVKTTLRKIADKINLHKPEKCGICGKTISDKSRPPYGLVGRLNAVSRQHRRFLSGPVRKWPVGDAGYRTSGRSLLMVNAETT